MYGFAFAWGLTYSAQQVQGLPPSLSLSPFSPLFALSLPLVSPLSSPVAGVELLISTAMNTLPKDGEGSGGTLCVCVCVCVCWAVLFLSHQLIPGDSFSVGGDTLHL